MTRVDGKQILLVLAAFAFCAHARGADLQVLATEGETRVTDITDPMNKKDLGRTPLTMKNLDGNEAYVLLLEKPGFAPVYVPISGPLQKNITVSVQMRRAIDWTPEELTRKAVETAESIVDQIMTVQALLDARKLGEAMPLLENLRNEHPTSLSVKLIYANALLLNGEVARADAMYGTILGEIPSSRKYLKDAVESVRARVRGVRTPAGGAR